MRRMQSALFILVVLFAVPAAGHDIDTGASVIIDTDMGIDDAVTMALALQCPQIRISAVVSCEGAADCDTGVRVLGCMFDEFNRGDIALYSPAPAKSPRPVPEFRRFAQSTIEKVLRGQPQSAQGFVPEAYLDDRGKQTIVLALGPLTNLAAALQDDSVRSGIARIVVPGPSHAKQNWNLTYDPDAWAAVSRSGVPVQFVESGTASKPNEWRSGKPSGQGTTIGEAFIARLFSDPAFREHYTQGVFERFTDELVLLSCFDHHLFDAEELPSAQATCLRPRDREEIIAAFTQIMSEGRQGKQRVVFAPGSLPNNILRGDVRKRKPGILANNGESEWFAQLLMNELHEHLGSYSILGVKMGLRAAELLNAPSHGMRVVSHAAARPPVSCLNDGVIVATGSTPGRTLFRHEPGPAGSTRVSFTYNGRRLTLAVKDEYRRKVKANIDRLLETYTLEDAEYWEGVREVSLDIWENWHRRDLFDVIEDTSAP